MVGINTMLQDNLLLTCRIPDGRNLLRMVCDPGLRVLLDNAFVKTVAEVPILPACCVNDTARCEAYPAAGCEVLTLPGRRVNLRAPLTSLDTRGINEAPIEGDTEPGRTLLSASLVQHV